MNVGILLITHGEIGATLLQASTDVLGICPLTAKAIPAPTCCNPEDVYKRASEAANELDSGDGVLVLTDLFGATPNNISCRLSKHHDVRVVAGINLPMLIRVFNYPHLELDELTSKALSGGQDGVLVCTTDECTHAK